jgi:hypothetical protein
MAMKSKVTKGLAKKTGVKKKTKKHKRRAGLTLGIGVVSSIKVPPALRAAFKRGLNNPDVLIKVEHAASYKKNKLKLKVQQFNADVDIGLIITVGGSITYEAADSFATKPFLSLVGVTPATPGTKCFGGVTLQSYQSNPLRIGHLEGKGYAKAQIGLFHNPNSAMASAEKAAWTGATPLPGGVNSSGDNDFTTYPADFAKLPSSVTAVVISADPYFQETKDALVDAANTSGQYICYPLQDYGGASPKPTHLKATLYGPALVDPYALLGERAAKVLATGAKLAPLFVSVPDTIKDL